MTFEPVALGGGSIGVRATGKIESGDDVRLRAALEAAKPTPDGWIPLLLSSGGGEAGPALALAEIIRQRKLMPVVLPGNSCDSACATILLLAAERSLVSEGGTLFYHACRSQNATESDLRECNAAISKIMRDRYGISDEMFLDTLNGFVGDETAVSREDRLLHAPVVDCLAIDLPPWKTSRPNETRCGKGDLLSRDPMAARYDVDPGTSTAPEGVPGTAHPVWFLFHWTPPDQWAFWRIGDGVGVAMRPRNTFRNGPELRIFCGVNPPASAHTPRVYADLRLAASPELERASKLAIRGGSTAIAEIGLADRFFEGPFVVDRIADTQRIVAEFEQSIWNSLSEARSDVTISLEDRFGRQIWSKTYTNAGLASRVPNARKHCVGALTPVE